MPTTKIDPACAICGRNDAQICGCEAQALEIATQQAEEIKMSPIHKEIRYVASSASLSRCIFHLVNRIYTETT